MTANAVASEADSSAVSRDSIAPLSARGSTGLGHLSDGELLETTRQLVGASNQIFAALLLHLAEVETRGIHRIRACATLYTYCIYELRFSEDAAYRRVSAARFVQRFPALVDAVASGELHLTGLLMIGPHLTPANVSEVLARAKHRTKKELGRLVRELDPLPDVPARIEPLGPPLIPASSRNGTWADLIRAHEGPVRQLRPDESPRNWMSDSPLHVAERAMSAADGREPSGASPVAGATAEANSALARTSDPKPAPARANDAAPARANDAAPARANDAAPARANDAAPARANERFQVQFTVTQEYVDLVERAQALLGQSANEALAELHLQAMQALVARLEKRKYAVSDAPARSGESSEVAEKEHNDAAPASVRHKIPRRRGRYIPAPIRRAVFLRDQQRCTYVDDRGQRCRETHRLQFHHLDPFARGGVHSADNLTLRCRPHNRLAAEQDFGREHMSKRGRGAAHEAFAHQTLPTPTDGDQAGEPEW